MFSPASQTREGLGSYHSCRCVCVCVCVCVCCDVSPTRALGCYQLYQCPIILYIHMYVRMCVCLCVQVVLALCTHLDLSGRERKVLAEVLQKCFKAVNFATQVSPTALIQ